MAHSRSDPRNVEYWSTGPQRSARIADRPRYSECESTASIASSGGVHDHILCLPPRASEPPTNSRPALKLARIGNRRQGGS